MSGTETNGDTREELDPSAIEVLQHSVSETLFRTAKLDQRIAAVDAIVRDCADNTFRLLQRTDPLTWTRRAAILGLGASVGSAIGAAIVHTIFLAYFR